MVIIFWDFLMFYQIFLNETSGKQHGIYELQNDLILGN